MLTAKKYQKGFSQLIIIAVLALGLLGGLTLVGQQTNLFPKASEPKKARPVPSSKPVPVSANKIAQVYFAYKTGGNSEAYKRICDNYSVKKGFTKCSIWSIVNLSNYRGVGNEKYWTYGASAFWLGNTPYFREVLVDLNRTDFYGRTCRIKLGKDADFTKCTGWTKANLGIVSKNHEIDDYSGYSEKVENKNGTDNLVQSVIVNYPPDKSNKEGYFRYCPIGILGPEWDKCPSWSGPVKLNPIQGGNSERYLDIGEFTFTGTFEGKNNVTILRQTLLSSTDDAERRYQYNRHCPFEANGANWGKCTSWVKEDLVNLRGVGNETYEMVAFYEIPTKAPKGQAGAQVVEDETMNFTEPAFPQEQTSDSVTQPEDQNSLSF